MYFRGKIKSLVYCEVDAVFSKDKIHLHKDIVERKAVISGDVKYLHDLSDYSLRFYNVHPKDERHWKVSKIGIKYSDAEMNQCKDMLVLNWWNTIKMRIIHRRGLVFQAGFVNSIIVPCIVTIPVTIIIIWLHFLFASGISEPNEKHKKTNSKSYNENCGEDSTYHK